MEQLDITFSALCYSLSVNYFIIPDHLITTLQVGQVWLQDIEKECGMRNRAGEINLKEKKKKRAAQLSVLELVSGSKTG